MVGDFVHFETMADNYCVFNARDGRVVRGIACGEPVFSCPVAGSDVVYFTTNGSQVYAPATRNERPPARFFRRGSRWTFSQLAKNDPSASAMMACVPRR